MSKTKQEFVEDSREQLKNVHDNLQGLPVSVLKELQRADSLPYAVCCLNVYGDLNTGILARTACLFGAERFFIIGRRKYDKRSTVGAHNYIDIVKVSAKDHETQELKEGPFRETMEQYGYTPVFVEQNGVFLTEIDWKKHVGIAGEKICLVFGNEATGIPEGFIKDTDLVVSVPQLGVLRSLNVATAGAVVMFDIFRDLASL